MQLDAKSLTPVEIHLEPLTKQDRTGQKYKRSSAVEAQIIEALRLDPPALTKRLDVRDFRAPGYLQEETLIYLIRWHHRAENDELVNLLTHTLIKRCSRHINREIEDLIDPAYAQDCFRDVIGTVFGHILDLDSNRCDYAQVKFWHWLDRVALKVRIQYWKKQDIDLITDALDDDEDESKEEKVRQKVEALKDPSPLPDLQAINREALSILKPAERLLYVLRYYYEWEIESKDPSIMTISKYFKVGERAIRYRLTKIEAKLQGWRGGQQ